MSTVCTEPTKTANPSRDSFALGVAVMLAFNVVQRLIGLGRNFGFCQFLTDDELGHWALANSFFIIGVPLAVLGLPGSFGKFVEHFRSRGCLGDYVFRILIVSGIGIGLLAIALFSFPNQFAWTIYGEIAPMRVIAWTALTLLAVTIFNVVYELVIALRLSRVGSSMQFIQSAGFAVIGMGGIAYTRSWEILLPSYALACLLGAIPGIASVFLGRESDMKRTKTLTHSSMWIRIVPFAAALWLTNLLTNAFELVDRYMLLHYCEGGEGVGQSLVGQFYCGRIIPNLLLSLAMTLGGILLPYLSADWEAKRFDSIQRRMRQVLTIVCVLFASLSVASLLGAPVLFDWILQGRYSEAESIFGIALAQCTWSSLAMIASAYLLCAEKGKQVSLVLAFGLLINLGLNAPLIQQYGLYGSILATWIANGVVLSLTFWRVSREGCRIHWGTYFICLTPSLLLFGPIAAAVGLSTLFFIASRTEWLLTCQDRKEIDQLVLPQLSKLGFKPASLWP